MPVPMRNTIGRNSPQRIYEFGDKIHERMIKENEKKKEERERSGKISGGKLGKPTLWAVLDIIGVPDTGLDEAYILGKFQRGNDVEDRAIQMLTGIDPHYVEPGKLIEKNDGILTGEFVLQKEGGYRDGTGYIDLAQKVGEQWVYHEIKSSTKLGFDAIAASGRYLKTGANPEKGIGVPKLNNAIQLAYYCLGDNITRGFIHYLNADDYRLVSFAINPIDYKEEIDKEIDDIQLAFAEKRLPAFEGFLAWHSMKKYWSYPEWNELSPDEMMFKLQHDFPEQYKKFMEMSL